MLSRDRVNIPMEALAELCRRYHMRELALFGSVLRDDFADDSDIDILVEYEPGARVTLFDHFDLQRAIEALLGRPVDLVPKDGLRSLRRESVLASSEVINAA